MKKTVSIISRWWLLILLLSLLILVIYFRAPEYLSYATLKKYHYQLQEWTNHHYLLTVLGYMFIYIGTVALSLPGAVYLTLAGGFLFGPIATIYVVIAATIGACLIFRAISTAVGKKLANRAKGWLAQMEKGFRHSAFNYLLVLRLIPVIPFWAINIGAALLDVPLRTFFLATFIGIIPGSFVYVMVGNSLKTVLETTKTPNLNVIFTPAVLFPLLGLALLSLIPLIYHRWKGARDV